MHTEKGDALLKSVILILIKDPMFDLVADKTILSLQFKYNLKLALILATNLNLGISNIDSSITDWIEYFFYLYYTEQGFCFVFLCKVTGIIMTVHLSLKQPLLFYCRW